MRGATGGPRLLLRRLREVMAEPVGAQARLDKIVTLIAFVGYQRWLARRFPEPSEFERA